MVQIRPSYLGGSRQSHGCLGMLIDPKHTFSRIGHARMTHFLVEAGIESEVSEATSSTTWKFEATGWTSHTSLHCIVQRITGGMAFWCHGILTSSYATFVATCIICIMYIYIYTYTHISFESSFAMPFQVWLCTKLSLIVCHACPLIRHWAFARTISLRHFQRISDVCLRQRETGTEGTEKPLGRCQEMQNIAASKSNEK